jgi:hypothetical protein
VGTLSLAGFLDRSEWSMPRLAALPLKPVLLVQEAGWAPVLVGRMQKTYLSYQAQTVHFIVSGKCQLSYRALQFLEI